MFTKFQPGDTKTHRFTVQAEDVAAFNGVVVHPVCATFTLAREIEWSSRLFVLEMKEADEEGIGTHLSIEHCGPALVGEVVIIIATVLSQEKNSLICSYIAQVGDRIVAKGETGQKILKKDKIQSLFSGLK